MTALLAIDQGTTSTRAIVFRGEDAVALAAAQRELPQSFPKPGWVEHDAQRIWYDTQSCMREALDRSGLAPSQIAAVGITNQRETVVVWDRKTHRPIAPAIVWQDRRTSRFCRERASENNWLRDRTGLLLDPYFSATKIAWILDSVPGARKRAENGELACGTIDSWLIWKLTDGQTHATDMSNASRTALLNIEKQDWDDDLLRFFDIPRAMLPQIRDCNAHFGNTDESLLDGRIAIHGAAGDQQAATVGQACFAPGSLKSTYGTGCFVVLNTGSELQRSRHRLLTTIAYRISGKTTYALEGSIFVAGAAVQWLRDGLKLVESAAETEALARGARDDSQVYLVPAFTGLGAPHWDPDARGALLGLTRDSGIAEIARATLEAVAYQTRDLFDAMAEDAIQPTELRVDGGMVANDWLMSFLADQLGVVVRRPANIETTALGAAFLAGLGCGLYKNTDEVCRLWKPDRDFTPTEDRRDPDRRHAGWLDAVRRVLTQP